MPKSHRRAVYKGLLGRPLGPSLGSSDEERVAYYLWHELRDTLEGRELRADYEEDAFDALFRHYGVRRSETNAERKLIWILAREAKVPAFQAASRPRGRPPEDTPILVLHQVLAMRDYLASQGAKHTGDTAACAALTTTPKYSAFTTRQLYSIVKKARRNLRVVDKATALYRKVPTTESVEHLRHRERRSKAITP